MVIFKKNLKPNTLDFKEIYKKETGNDANGNIQLYAGDRQGIDIINEEYVVWLEKRLAKHHYLHVNGYVNIKDIEPKLFDLISIDGGETYEQYIGEGQILTSNGDIIKFEQYIF